MREIDLGNTALAEIEKPQQAELESFHDDYVFRVDYASDTPSAVLRNDLATYLAEYRLHVQKSQYELLYTTGEDGKRSLRSSDNGQSMLEIGSNGIKERIKAGKSVRKETADLFGMQQIETYMAEAQEGDTILWASPPDPEVGYTYGFFYVGHVAVIEGKEKKLTISATRLDKNPTRTQFNAALSILTGTEVNHETVNQFISQPVRVARNIHEQELDFVLQGTFAFTEDKGEEKRKRQVLAMLSSYYPLFEQAVRENAPLEERKRIIFSLENFAPVLEQQLEQEERASKRVFPEPRGPAVLPRADFLGAYGFIPPRVVGSCDVPGEFSSPNIFGYTSIFTEPTSFLGFTAEPSDTYGKRTFNCPHCKYENKRPHNKLIKYCQNNSCGKDVSC